METIQIILLIIFFVASIVGYLVINNVPSLLHTPLMSGMNALSGVTILGALLATAVGVKQMPILSYVLGSIAIISAMINVVGGFGITDRMLHIIAKRGGKHGK